MKKIILTLVVVLIIIQGASWLMSRSGSSGSGVSVGNGGANSGGVSVGPVKGTAAGATAGDGKQCAVMHGARPAAFPSLPAYEPGEEPRAGLVAFVYETPGFASIDAIQGVGDGTQPNLGWFRWKPIRKGEMHLFDAGSGTGMATSRALSYILRGGHEIPFGGAATETLRLQYPELKTGLRCSMHILVGGSDYAADLFSCPKGAPAGTLETTASFEDLPPGAKLDIGYAFSCATEDGSQEILKQIVIDPMERTQQRPPRLLGEGDFFFPRSAL